MQADLTTDRPNWRYRCLKCHQDFDLPEGSTSCPSDSSPLVPLLGDPLIGSLFDGKYRILDQIGCGSTSRIYKARHQDLQIDLAVKVLQQVFGTDQRQVARFQQEAKLAGSLSNPNVIRIYDCGVEPEPYIAMEFVNGLTLATLIKESGAIQPAHAFTIFQKICQGMQAAHELGLIHRDLKPSNIMILQNSLDLRIIDFGIARSLYNDDRYTRTGETLGSPPYMSPEQCRGENLDARSDIYSFGCLMYEVLTGIRPFAGKNAVETIFKQIETAAPLLKEICPNQNFPAGTNQLLDRCLAKDPHKRYQSMIELKCDLELIQAGKGKKIKRLASTKPALLKTGSTIAAVVLALVLAAAIVFLRKPAIENPNKLAIGKHSLYNEKLNLAINPAFCLNGKTREAIISLRRKYVEEHKTLLLNPYRPDNAVFGGIVDKRPWWGMKGLYLHLQGPEATVGPSLESISIANPYCLVGIIVEDAPDWKRAIISNSDKIKDFPYVCMPEDLQWFPHLSKMEVTYNLTSYAERIRELEHASPDKANCKFHVDNCYYNARDLGFNYLSSKFEPSLGTEISQDVVPNTQILHGGHACGIPCNNLGDGNSFNNYDVKPPCDERIFLWRKRPLANVAPDITCLIHFK